MSRLKTTDYINRFVIIKKPIKLKGLIGRVLQLFDANIKGKNHTMCTVEYLDNHKTEIFKLSNVRALRERELKENGLI